MGTGPTLGEQGGGGGLHGNDPAIRIVGFEDRSGSGDGATGARCTDEDIHLAVHIPQDLRPGGFRMGLGIGGVAELVKDHGIGMRPVDLLRFLDGACHSL